MSDTKLLRCPFCGKKLIADSKNFFVHPVAGCLMDGMPIKNDDESIKRWNTRKPMQKIVKRLEEEIRNYETRFTYYDTGWNNGIHKGIEIVKEEGGVDA